MLNLLLWLGFALDPRKKLTALQPNLPTGFKELLRSREGMGKHGYNTGGKKGKKGDITEGGKAGNLRKFVPALYQILGSAPAL